jgi:hypothetical protein
MDNAIINMKLTPQEAVLIENIRASATLTNFGGTGNTSTLTFQEWLDGKTEPVRQSDEQRREELLVRYMNMTDEGFIDVYAKTIGDDTILAVLQDTLTYEQKSKAVLSSLVQTPGYDIMTIDDYDELVEDLFEAYVSNLQRRTLFLQTNDREELVAQLVDMIINGDWEPENR